jgi:ADP-ribose pyrophosphatase YjhB (NUDIX family)
MKEEKLTLYGSRAFPKYPHVGVGTLLIRDNTLLLVKRKYNPDAGMWSIPGGHLKIGEKTKIGAEREMEEETGIKVKVKKLAGIIDKIVRDEKGKIKYHYVLLNYFVEQKEGDPNKKPIAQDDALDAKFVDIDNLKNYRLTHSLIELLKELKLGY